MMSKFKNYKKRVVKSKRIFRFLTNKFCTLHKLPLPYVFVTTNTELVKIRFGNLFKFNIKELRFIFSRRAFKSNIEYKSGEAKIVVFNDDKALYLYKSSWVYNKAKTNYLSYKDLLPYRYSEIYEFDDKNMSAVAKKLGGASKRDEKSYIEDIQYFVNHISETKVLNKNGKDRLCSVQHGDAKPGNMLRDENNEIIFFDLDFIGYRPIFNDLIHYISNTSRDKNILYKVIEENFNKLNSLYKDFKDFKSVDELYNEIVEGYIDCFVKKPATFKPCFDFLL